MLEAGRHNLQPELAPRLYVERAMRQARAGARYTRDLVALEVADPDLRASGRRSGRGRGRRVRGVC